MAFCFHPNFFGIVVVNTRTIIKTNWRVWRISVTPDRPLLCAKRYFYVLSCSFTKTIVFLRVVVFDTVDVVLNVHSERHSI